MSTRRLIAAIVALVLLAGAGIYLFALERKPGSPVRPARTERSVEEESAATADESVLAAGGTSASKRTALDEPPAPTRAPSPEVEVSEPADPLQQVLERLRAIVEREDYHDVAWPSVVELGQLSGSEGRADVDPSRVAAAAYDEAEHDRLRSACALGLALARSDLATELADVLEQARSPELQRAGWLARSLLASGPEGLRIELRAFDPRPRVYPIVAHRLAEQAVIRQALQRAERPMSADTDGVSEAANALRAEESLVRQVAILAILGPAANSPGEVRERMLRWLEERTSEAAAAWPAALHCLALAARDDAELAERLLAIARARLFDRVGVSILKALATLSGREDLVASVIEQFFRGEGQMEDGPKRTLAQAGALEVLEALLRSADEELRRRAIELAMERVLDPELEEFQRSLLLAMLSGTEVGSQALFDILSLVATDADSRSLAMNLTFLSEAPSDQDQQSHAFLVQMLAQRGEDVDLRRALLTEIAEIGAPGALDVIRAQLALETDAELRELLERLEDELLGQ